MQSEEDQALKSDLELLVERLKVIGLMGPLPSSCVCPAVLILPLLAVYLSTLAYVCVPSKQLQPLKRSCRNAINTIRNLTLISTSQPWNPCGPSSARQQRA